MHQLLTAQSSNQQSLSSTLNAIKQQKGASVNEIISLSSFEIIKNLQMPLTLYMVLILFEFVYMITIPAQRIYSDNVVLTSDLFTVMTANGVYVSAIIITGILFFILGVIFFRGRNLKEQQSRGEEKTGGAMGESNIMQVLTKLAGAFLIFLSTALSQLFLRIIPETFSCDKDFEIAGGCDSILRKIAIYSSIAGFPMLVSVLLISDYFITSLFPNEHIPWASWRDSSRILRNIYKAIQVSSITVIPSDYQLIINIVVIYFAAMIILERFNAPQIYNRYVHILITTMECEVFTYTIIDAIVNLIGFKLQYASLVYIGFLGAFLAIVLIMLIDQMESRIITQGNDPASLGGVEEAELYLVVMLHELERLVGSEEYAHEKHVHAIIGRHMEACARTQCPCKSYEPEYDKKFTTVFLSRRMTKQFSSAVNSGSSFGARANSLADLKRLPYKINYRTKVEIFKKEFEDKVESFLEEHPKSYGIKLLKSFFNHKYCDSSYKALFVQLENSITCKNFKGKVFIYHLKTKIQDEMKKSTESPLSIDINSLLRFEKYKIDFERYLEELSYDCQSFWTDLSKDDYKVDAALKVAYMVSSKIIKIKEIFSKIISINHQCIDTSSTYALVYRHILRDEATFNDLVNRIQQIKNSSKLEQQREHGVRFFDSDIYGLLMVSGEVKELGRVKQANSSNRFVFGYDPKDLIGSRINKLMPLPFANLHDKFMMNFLAQGKSSFLDRNQPLPVITKDGFLQMTLFYVKPMVSLEFGLIFASFAKRLNQYNLADEAPELIKLHKLCIAITDKEGNVHGLSESCTKKMGVPPPAIATQLAMNDNQKFRIHQLCVLPQDCEFDIVKGFKTTVTTKFLRKERMYRKDHPEYANKLSDYEAEVGIHKFNYRDYEQEMAIYVMKLSEKDGFGQRGKNVDFDSQASKSDDDDLTYSEFSITTANSSVISSHMATSKFKTFKSKIQTMTESSQINHFSRLALITFFLLLGIAAGNFTINLVKNRSFMQNLDVITNLQILMQQVPEQAHSTRQLMLISNGFVKTKDESIAAFNETYSSKYQFFAYSLYRASQLFENIQNHIQTSLNALIQLDRYQIRVKDVKTDGDIREMTQSLQTSINLFSSKILKMSSLYDGARGGVGLPNGTSSPNITLNWDPSRMKIGSLEQDLFYIIENGLGSIFEGIKSILNQMRDSITKSSQDASIISIILTAISIILVLVLLPMSYQPLTHVERISRIILMSLNKLPEQFCLNETKACMEIVTFLSEQKEGEKSTHDMIKKHDHRKHNKQILKLPKNRQGMLEEGDSMMSSYLDSYTSDAESKSIFGERRKSNFDDNASTHSRDSAEPVQSKMTKLSQVKVEHAPPKLKRGEGGTFELDLTHAKTSEVQDDPVDDDPDNDDRELSEEEQKQKDREHERKEAIDATFRSQRINKFLLLIVTAFVISVYYGITCFYLNLIHQHEQIYLDHYSLIGRRIQCYTNVQSYLIDSLARNSNMTLPIERTTNAAGYYLQDCFDQEQDYKQLMLDGLTVYKSLDTFNAMNDRYEGNNMCQTLAELAPTLPSDGVRVSNITKERCDAVMKGILINGGLTETLYHVLRSIQDVLLIFEDRNNKTAAQGLNITKSLLLTRQETNELISLNEIYLQAAFELIRRESLTIIQDYFTKMTNYYNMLFGIFVCLLSLSQMFVAAYLVKRLSKQIVMIYHVVLLVPFSGRTQNELNTLMMIKM